RPLDSVQRDVVVLQAVSAGKRAGEYVEELQRSGDYGRMLYVNGLASGTAEALADYAHHLARRELGLPENQGLRFSWGYAACPDLEEQRKVLPLLNAESEIGLTLSLSNNLDPEHSTAAIVLHHPQAKYFSVRAAGKQAVVLYFYPRDDTPGCTAEACSFRDLRSLFNEHGAEILGVSADTVKSHKKFRDKFHLTFPLLADTDHAVADQYGVWQLKKFMGREYMGIART